jgi:hypothetical protein
MLAGGTNSVLLGLLLGSQNDVPYNGNAINVSDAAAAHVRALDPSVPGNQEFYLTTDIVFEDAIAIAKKHYPKAVADGRLKNNGKQPTSPLKFDSSKVCHCPIQLLFPVECVANFLTYDRLRRFSPSNLSPLRPLSRRLPGSTWICLPRNDSQVILVLGRHLV